MKIFTKLFLSIVLILTVTLTFVHFITVSDTFDSQLKVETDSALIKHQMAKYAVLADFRAAEASSDVDYQTLQDLAVADANNFAILIILSDEIDDIDEDEGNIKYWVEEQDDQENLRVQSILKTSIGDYLFETRSDVSKIYDSSREMSGRYRGIFLIAELIGAVLAVGLSLSVTVPIRKLTRASKEMAAGNYALKIRNGRKDELGELSESFDSMKKSVTDTMDQLELASKQKDDFVGNFAHELKTPMTSIIGYADTIYSGNLSEAEMKEAAKFILNEGLRLESLSFKLLELITIKDNKFILEDTDTYQFFEDTQQTVMPAAEKKGVKVYFACESVYIKIEYDLFKTMVMNLIDNAFKSGGNIVEVTGRTISEKDRTYRISIRDNGRGIPKEELGRITEAFYMIDKSRSRAEHGAGLGLALCERVARLHNTTLEFESEVGKGTVVSFVMKISEEVIEE